MSFTPITRDFFSKYFLVSFLSLWPGADFLEFDSNRIIIFIVLLHGVFIESEYLLFLSGIQEILTPVSIRAVLDTQTIY